jgi:hypothetical protein
MTTTTLAGKIAAASKDVGGILATDKTNTQQKYDYISADKILSVCGQALADQGVVVFPAITDEHVSAVEYAGGRTRYDAAVRFLFTVSDGTTQLELPFVGRGSDYTVPDKATYKAITSGHKYFLSKLLAIGAGNEDGEHEVEPQPAPLRVTRPALRQATLPELAPSAADDIVDSSFDGMDADQLRSEVHTIGAKLWPDKWDEVRDSNIAKLTGGRTTDIDDLSVDELRRMLDGLAKKQQRSPRPEGTRTPVATNGH